MAERDQGEDIAAIRAIVSRQFSNLSWTRASEANWDGFAADFLPGATLYPAVRPASALSVSAFVARMQGLAGGALASFEETALGCDIRVFGNVAVAVAACEMVENGGETGRSVEMMLLVRNEDGWRIAAQAWDKASSCRPVPDDLLGPAATDGARPD
jgi:hypothetical protein